MDRQEIIQVKNLHKSFSVGKRFNSVLKDIDLEIYKNELIIIFGPSGCGKSTLLNTVMGIERPDKGTVRIFGISLWSMNADDRADMRKRNIGVVYQQQNWIKSLSLLENVSLSAQLLGYDKETAIEKAKEAIRLVGLSENQNNYTTELSAGEQQKAGLARALISNPQVIIADEPTGNLDSKSGSEVIDLLKFLTEQGKTIVLVTHNPEYLVYASRVIAMKDGKIIGIVKHSDNVEDEVERLIDESSVEGEQIYKDSDATKPSFTELDYPNTPFLEKVFTYASFIGKFFVESILLLLSFIISKIFRVDGERIRGYFSKKLRPNSKISNEISNLELTEISFKNLFFNKFRTVATILGVGIGTGFVLLLLSFGYGFEHIVVKEMTTAQDLKQLDVYPKVGSLLVLDDNLVEKIEDVEGVVDTYTLKNFAGRINYEGSTADVVVYGVQDGYLENSPSKKVAGEYLGADSDEVSMLVNLEYLNLLGIEKDEILGKTLEVEIVNSTPTEEKIEPIDVVVAGVIEDDYSPVAYLRMADVSEYTSDTYSQATVIVNSESSIDSVRKQVESLGLESFSVMDTIDQVETLFTYVRYGLFFFGIIAFTISFLGMVNTLSVSLLERTKEVALMKIIGMKKNEIMSIFITESMLISFLGGLLGVIFGIVGGYIVSVIIYAFTSSRGVDFIMVSTIPLYVLILIVVCTTLIGFFTGLFPAKRAVKIPPLDALRYE